MKFMICVMSSMLKHDKEGSVIRSLNKVKRTVKFGEIQLRFFTLAAIVWHCISIEDRDRLSNLVLCYTSRRSKINVFVMKCKNL